MIGRVNYALSMRRHKRQKAGSNATVNVRKSESRASGPHAASSNRKVPTTVLWHRGPACRRWPPSQTNASRDWPEVEHHPAHLASHVFPAMSGDSKDRAPMTIG